MEMGGVDYAGEFDIIELKLILPTGQILNLDKDFMMLNCHGRPKPHQLEEMGWPPIKNIWR